MTIMYHNDELSWTMSWVGWEEFGYFLQTRDMMGSESFSKQLTQLIIVAHNCHNNILGWELMHQSLTTNLKKLQWNWEFTIICMMKVQISKPSANFAKNHFEISVIWWSIMWGITELQTRNYHIVVKFVEKVFYFVYILPIYIWFWFCFL